MGRCGHGLLRLGLSVGWLVGWLVDSMVLGCLVSAWSVMRMVLDVTSDVG